MTLADYHRLLPVQYGNTRLFVKAGARGYPDPRYELMARVLEPFGERAVDLNPGVGLASVGLLEQIPVDLVETSRACLRCLEKSFAAHPGARVLRGLPWEVEAEAYDQAVLVIPAERGSRYVELALWGAAHSLRPGGRLWIAGDTKKGFETYFKQAQARLGYGLVSHREGSLRVAVLEKEKPTPPSGSMWESFEAEIWGHPLIFRHLPGVFSTGHLDPASTLLLHTFFEDNWAEDVKGRTVLDLGGGYAGLSLPFAAAGASVTVAEDDWVSILSAQASFQANGLEGRVVHSDVEEALPSTDRFDIIVSNPPFHLGGEVILDVAQAFVQAASSRLRSGGRFYLVANSFLKYEPLLEAAFGNLSTLRRGGYKVLRSEA
ncbi:MAG: methyltransferase [Meiothermus silvanus]|nr:methyltransferase [Allomeiothermus silvanus]